MGHLATPSVVEIHVPSSRMDGRSRARGDQRLRTPRTAPLSTMKAHLSPKERRVPAVEGAHNAGMATRLKGVGARLRRTRLWLSRPLGHRVLTYEHLGDGVL
jgi:hypothetical protein